MEKTREEIEDLKAQWKADPIWDLWNTEGFEDHYDELSTFQMVCEVEWKQQAENEFAEFQKLIGTKNKKLSVFLFAMANRIKYLESEITVLKGIRYN